MSSFQDRISFKGDFDELISKVVREFNLGELTSYTVVEIGFQDLNVKMVTSDGEYLIKMFAKSRDIDEARRYTERIGKALEGGVHHPALQMNSQGGALHTDSESGVSLIVMTFVYGKTFYDMSRVPDDDELMLIIREAVKINQISYKPGYIFDSWAIPNMRWMFDKTKEHLNEEGLVLVDKAFECFEAIPFDKLPMCFVHGDIIKSNVIKGDDGNMYVVDFAVSNTYPRIQELAVMAANLMFDEKATEQSSLRQRADKLIDFYERAGGELTQLEKDTVFDYALPGAAMEYMGSVNERIVGGENDEILFWEKQGLETLREALQQLRS